jgi:hypothetical protein
MSFFSPPPEGFRPVEYNRDGTIRGNLDKVEEARAAQQGERAKARETSADSSGLTDPIGFDVPIDVFDLALASLVANESHLIRNKEMSLDTPER